ncbi:MAG TPA: type II toxin-antitoxin system RelE/ParE family toxin [Tepidiformaceae bacterium]|nr:type II toxin-antitoxin system RelE/ParE family toxin [Tepidiformaceae bacterium]
MSYRVEVAAHARRYLARLAPEARRQVIGRLEDLANDPLSRSFSKPLHGALAGRRSSEVGGLRIIFTVDRVVRVVAVSDIGPRGDIYKR